MGLDIYAGSLTRYYSGHWETIVQEAAREQGLTVRISRPELAGTSGDPAKIRAAVLAWRERLAQALSGVANGPFDWDEDTATPYVTDKPDLEPYTALLLWAAYADQPTLKHPASFRVDAWQHDAALTASVAPGFQTRYPHLLLGAELWLPVSLAQPIAVPDVRGEQTIMGAVPQLAEELQALNHNTWRADESAKAAWLDAGPPKNVNGSTPFERAAKFGFGVVDAVARQAVHLRLPMKLDI